METATLTDRQRELIELVYERRLEIGTLSTLPSTVLSRFPNEFDELTGSTREDHVAWGASNSPEWMAALEKVLSLHDTMRETTPDVDWAPAESEPEPEPVEPTVPRHELDRANERIEQLRSQLAEARAEITDVNDERLAPIWKKAAQAADDEDFCPEYDRLANSLGIPGRERVYRGIVTVTFNVYAYAKDTSPDGAGEEMEEMVRARLDEYLTTGSYGEGEISHLDYNSVSVEDVNPY